MQIAQKLEAEEEGKQGDQPVTRKDFEALLAKIETLEVLARDSQKKKDGVTDVSIGIKIALISSCVRYKAYPCDRHQDGSPLDYTPSGRQ